MLLVGKKQFEEFKKEDKKIKRKKKKSLTKSIDCVILNI